MADRSSNSTGATWMMVSMAGFAGNDVLMKLVMSDVGLFQSIAVRNAIGIVGILVLCWRMKAFDVPDGVGKALAQPAVLLRIAAETAAAYFFLTALTMMPLANATAVLQLLPLAITLAAALFLRESVGWRRWLATLAGFAGVMLILRPGPEGFDISALYALTAVVCVTVRDLATRRVDPSTPSLLITLATAAAILGLGLVGLLFEPWVAMTSTQTSILIGSAATIMVAYIASIAAMRVGDVSFVAPFRYSIMIWALLFGWLVFAELPTALELLGTAIIVASGLYTFSRERAVSLATSIPAASRRA